MLVSKVGQELVRLTDVLDMLTFTNPCNERETAMAKHCLGQGLAAQVGINSVRLPVAQEFSCTMLKATAFWFVVNDNNSLLVCGKQCNI